MQTLKEKEDGGGKEGVEREDGEEEIEADVTKKQIIYHETFLIFH